MQVQLQMSACGNFNGHLNDHSHAHQWTFTCEWFYNICIYIYMHAYSMHESMENLTQSNILIILEKLYASNLSIINNHCPQFATQLISKVFLFQHSQENDKIHSECFFSLIYLQISCRKTIIYSCQMPIDSRCCSNSSPSPLDQSRSLTSKHVKLGMQVPKLSLQL